MTKKEREEYRKVGWSNYLESWGNYKSDKHKSKRIMRSEIMSILVHGVYTKTDLIDIRDFVKSIAFDEIENKPVDIKAFIKDLEKMKEQIKNVTEDINYEH